MDHAERIITKITGCSGQQAKAAIAALVEAGWTPPSVQASPEPAVPDAVVPPRLADVPSGSALVAHADGACSGNPGPGGWGVVFSLDGTVVGEFCGSEAAETTNNRMELTAAREAIKRAPLGASIEIVTDSQNVIGWLASGWKRKDPTIARLCGEIDRLRSDRAERGGKAVTFSYVRGHNGDPLNERADQLATGAIRQVS